MGVLFGIALIAASVKQEGAALRAGGCDTDAPVAARLAAGTEVEIRSSIAGAGGICYRVAARVEGREVTGNLPAAVLDGLEEFDRVRQVASAGDSVQMMSVQVDGLRRALSARAPGGVVQEASGFLDRNQPARALELLTPLTAGTRNPDILLLAGVAAWKSDRVKLALEHWRGAQSLRADPRVAAMIIRVETELAHDRSGERASGNRVSLRYEGEALPYDAAREMVEILDAEVTRLSGLLGCPFAEKLVAIVQSPEAYRRGASAAEWSGGQFDGRIRVPFAGRADTRLRQTFAHEVTHACLANLGSYPAWLHEGLAQKLSGERLGAAMRDSLRELASRKELPRLENFRQDWSRMSASHARIAYAVSLLAAGELMDGFGASIGLRTILGNPVILQQVTKDLNRRLGTEAGN